MIWKSEDYGEIEYTLPNPIERMRLLGKCKIGSEVIMKAEKDPGAAQDGIFIIVANLMDHIEPYIKRVDVILQEKEILSWSELIKEDEAMPCLMGLGTKFYYELNGRKSVEEKKG